MSDVGTKTDLLDLQGERSQVRQRPVHQNISPRPDRVFRGKFPRLEPGVEGVIMKGFEKVEHCQVR